MVVVSVLLLRPDCAMARSILGSSLIQTLMVIFVPMLVPSGANKTRGLVELRVASAETADVRESSVSPLSSFELSLSSIKTSS